MKLGRSLELSAAAFAATLIVLAVATALTVSAASEPEPARCCYTNPRYSGVCEVEPVEGESCASILEYLNSATAVGKTYCGGTDVRGGWRQVDCEE